MFSVWLYLSGSRVVIDTVTCRVADGRWVCLRYLYKEPRATVTSMTGSRDVPVSQYFEECTMLYVKTCCTSENSIQDWSQSKKQKSSHYRSLTPLSFFHVCSYALSSRRVSSSVSDSMSPCRISLCIAMLVLSKGRPGFLLDSVL